MHFDVGVLQFFGGIQGIEWIVLVALILLVLGGDNLPKIFKFIGRAAGEFEKGRKQIQEEISRMEEGTSRQVERSMPYTKSDRVRRAAEDLGIEVHGKTTQQLREEIKQELLEHPTESEGSAKRKEEE